jgi:hypothetical protein
MVLELLEDVVGKEDPGVDCIPKRSYENDNFTKRQVRAYILKISNGL